MLNVSHYFPLSVNEKEQFIIFSMFFCFLFSILKILIAWNSPHWPHFPHSLIYLYIPGPPSQNSCWFSLGMLTHCRHVKYWLCVHETVNILMYFMGITHNITNQVLSFAIKKCLSSLGGLLKLMKPWSKFLWKILYSSGHRTITFLILNGNHFFPYFILSLLNWVINMLSSLFMVD